MIFDKSLVKINVNKKKKAYSTALNLRTACLELEFRLD